MVPVRRLLGAITAAPACDLCSHPASTGWYLDPVGRPRGRCAGCVEPEPDALPAEPAP